MTLIISLFASFRNPPWKDGSTAVCILVIDDVVYAANIGDSKVSVRFYMSRATSLVGSMEAPSKAFLLFYCFLIG